MRLAPPPRARRRTASTGTSGSSRRRSPRPVGRSRSERSSGYGSPPRAIDEPVQLQPVGELLDDRLAGRRLGERGVQVPVEVVERLEQEEAALAARVGRLQHRREPDRLGGGRRLAPRAHRGEPRLRHAALGEPAPHRDLVRHQVRRLRADPGQAERLGDGGDDRHRAVGRDRQHAVDAVPPRDLDHAPRRRRSRRPRPRRRAGARPRRDCGRPRRPAARAASRAGSRAAGGAPRRRRERSSRRSDATWRNRNATRSQRAISQPFRARERGRRSAARGTSRARARPAARRRSACRPSPAAWARTGCSSSPRAVCTPPRARTSVPRTGSQWSVRTRGALVGPSGQTVIVRVAGEDTESTSETRAASTSSRLDSTAEWRSKARRS